MTERVNSQGQVLITRELLLHLGSCGISFDRPDQKNYHPEKENNLIDDHYFTVADMWGKPENEILNFLEENELFQDAAWYLKQKETELFVRYTGKEFTLGAYQVFNPLTGIHTRYETEDEAAIALVEVAKAVLAQHLPTVCQELSNENGDTCWTPIDFSNKYDIVKI